MSPLPSLSRRSLAQMAGLVGTVALLTLGALPLSAQETFDGGDRPDGPNGPSTIGGGEAYDPPSRGGPSGPSTIGGGETYDPPTGGRPQSGNHTGGGVRSCGDELAPLAPRVGTVGRTTNPRPTLTWYVYGDDARAIELHLYRYQDNGLLDEVFIRPVGTTTPGIMTYTLPATDAPLTAGSTYLWQVVMYCDGNREEVGQFVSADLEVVPPPASLPNPLPADPVAQAQAFGAAGLWYDALAAVSVATTTPEQDAFRRQLLLQLADLEDAAAGPEGAGSASDQLRRATGPDS